MSKLLTSFLMAALAVVTVSPSFSVRAQINTALLEVRPGTSPSVSIRLRNEARRNLSFPGSVGGIGDLQARITNVRLASFVSDQPVEFRELQPGEYLATRDFERVTYDVGLTPLKQRPAAAHASWIKGDAGILMLGDLLPRHVKGPLEITFAGDSPVQSIELEPDRRSARVADPHDSIFLVGSGWRGSATMQCRPCPVVYLSGSWHFTDNEAVAFAGEIIGNYVELFREPVAPSAQITIARFPIPTEPGAWQAETRGRNVTIISSDMPFRTQSLQRLHEQLRHEIFHLWIPNKLNLTGNYDWFYEGFALYQSLKLAVGVNRIRFEDFLDTLSRAHTIDSAFTQRPSLIDASKNRFSGLNTQVYARGMLVAFMTDLALMHDSKSSVDDLLRKLYNQHRKPAAPVDGNKAVIGLMSGNSRTGEIVKKYVTGAETINWKSELAAAGIEDIDTGPITTLRVVSKPNGRQKALLDKLGYNNWRNSSRNSK